MTSMPVNRRMFTAGLGALGVGAAIPVSAQSQPLKVRLDWTPWGVHGAIHLAQVKGWISKAGLTVDVQDGNGSAAAVQIVGSSEEFDLGHASLATLMVARSKGLPVKAVSVFYRQGDIGCFVPKDSGIRGPADLKGKKIVYTAGALEAPFIDTFLAAGGLKRSDVELVTVSAAAKAGTYATGQADAALSTIPFFLSAVAETRPSNAIRFADYGLEMPGYGLLARPSTIAAKRESISRYVSVVAASWTYIYQGHEDEAVDAIVSQRPQARLDRKVLRGQIDALRGFLDTQASKGMPLGVITPPDWEAAVKTLSVAGLVTPDIAAQEYIETGLVVPTALASL